MTSDRRRADRRSTRPPAATTGTTAGYHLASRRRATLERLVPAVCPPDVTSLGLVDAVVDHVEQSLGSIGVVRQRVVGVALDGVEAGAVLRHGRTLPRTGDDAVAAFVDGLTGSRAAPVRQAIRLLRDLVVMGYYDQPVVKQRLGYDPDAWTTTVAPARAARWSEAIRGHQEVLVRPSPAPRSPRS